MIKFYYLLYLTKNFNRVYQFNLLLFVLHKNIYNCILTIHNTNKFIWLYNNIIIYFKSIYKNSL